MKYLSFIILTLFFFIACSEEETVKVKETNKLIRISAELPKENTVTRAPISIPVTHQLRCIIEVWDETTSLVHREEKVIAGGEVTIPPFEFSLPSGNYECLIWADYISKDAATTQQASGEVTYSHYEERYYTTTDLHEITIIEEGKQLFDTDLCDAYFAKTEFKKGEEELQESIKLIRPFAKLIVKEKDTEKFNALQSMKVAYDIPKGFNISTGEPIGETLSVNYEKSFDGTNDSQELFSTYIFTPSTADRKALGKIQFAFQMNNGNQIDQTILVNSIFIKRNTRINASGNLIEENEITIEPEVGHFFFENGTWGAELTDVNKDKCIGIIYAVGPQTGDNISNYGQSNAGKKILGYVVSLKQLDVSGYNLDTNSNTSGRVHFYNKTLNVSNFFPAPEIDRTSHDGYAETETFLSSDLFKNAPTMYPALNCFKSWRESTSKPLTASDWHIPTINQLMTAVGGCYGYDYISVDFNGATAIPELAAAIKLAVEKGIAENIGSNRKDRGFNILHTTLESTKQTPIGIEINSEGTITAYKENRGAPLPVLIRPILTILK